MTSIKQAIEERRLGRFHILTETLLEAPEAVLQALSGCIVVEARYRYDLDAREYLAINAAFEPSPPHTEAPEYAVWFKSSPDAESVSLFDHFQKGTP